MKPSLKSVLLVVVGFGLLDEKWVLLGQTWELIHDPVKLDNYVETEIRKYLGGQ